MTKEPGVDQLILSGIELWLKVGCSKEERSFAQRVEMDVTLHMPLREAGQRDAMAATIDYSAVCALVRKKLEPRSFHLIEAVAEQTADLLRKKYTLEGVTVMVKKRALPGLAYAAVQIRRP